MNPYHFRNGKVKILTPIMVFHRDIPRQFTEKRLTLSSSRYSRSIGVYLLAIVISLAASIAGVAATSTNDVLKS